MVTISYADHKSRQVLCTDINVEITDSLTNSFITRNDVVELIERRMYSPIGHPLWHINTLQIEKHLFELHPVRMVSAFKTSDGRLNIQIEQRKPIMRVINSRNQSYYIDTEGQILPLSSKFTAHVLIINGNILEPFQIKPDVKILSWNGKPNEQPPLICQVFELGRYIAEDEFWNSQIAQIYVETPDDIELIPRVGAHVVKLGGVDDYETKLQKLKIFYERGLTAVGWNQYSEVNLKFKNQIICTKR